MMTKGTIMIEVEIVRDFDNGATHFFPIGARVMLTGEGKDFGAGVFPEAVDAEGLEQWLNPDKDYKVL
jgi:hypothetical protein